MNKLFYIFTLLFLFPFYTSAQSPFVQKRFTTSMEKKIEIEPVAGLGLDKIYLLKTLTGASVSYTTSKDNTVVIYTYQNSAADKNDITPIPTISGNEKTYTISNLQDSRGLIVEDGTGAAVMTKAVWIIDYSQHLPQFSSVSVETSADVCQKMKLMVDKSDLLQYRGLGISGEQIRSIPRKYNISYDIFDWDSDTNTFTEKTYAINGVEIGTEFIVDKDLDKYPNKNTKFTVSDQYASDLELTAKKESNIYEAVSVEGHIVAKQHDRENLNEMKGEGDLGGSAPVDIEFFGLANKPIAGFFTWFVYDKKNMNDPIARYTDEDFDYTFNQFGDYQVMLEVADAASTCVDTVSVQFTVSESHLYIPNFFSPGSSPGSNDEFKVAYKSLVKYKCVIFNRWGNKVYESQDPAQGWDGRYKGSLVKPGVYFYSIEATGSDGIKYKRGGDINILN